MPPNDVNDDNRQLVHRNLYGSMVVPGVRRKLMSDKIGFGDKIRINKLVHPFRKGYLPNWSEETFKVIATNKGSTHPMFKVKDTAGKLYEPRLYSDEVQVVTESPQTTYRIEKIIKTKTVDGITYNRVKWFGFPATFNTWEPSANVINLSTLNS